MCKLSTHAFDNSHLDFLSIRFEYSDHDRDRDDRDDRVVSLLYCDFEPRIFKTHQYFLDDSFNHSRKFSIFNTHKSGIMNLIYIMTMSVGIKIRMKGIIRY